jgi:hypothetical protein
MPTIEYYEKWKALGGTVETNLPIPALPMLLSRDKLLEEYAFAIPSPNALERVASFSPIVEIGAGGGYWAKLLTEMGAVVHAYDKAPPGSHRKNDWKMRLHFPVRYGEPSVLSDPQYAKGWTLFLCWPYMDSMAYECLQHFRGDTVIYIGEGSGGCTANDAFFEVLERDYEELDQMYIPQWPCIHDYLSVWERKTKSVQYDEVKNEV